MKAPDRKRAEITLKRKVTMQASELLQRIKSNRAPVIVDARSAIEFKRGHIPGAIHASALKILLKTAHLPEDRNLELVIYCGHGPRAMIAKRLLAVRGFRNTALLAGHMEGWKKADLPLER
jgi:rhodanese-related sulfurtransferase